MKWTTRDYVISGVFGAAAFAVAFALGAGVIVATGIPATGGLANILVAVLILTIGAHLCPKFGFMTLTAFILFFLAIPTVIGGPLGPYKVICGLAIGLTFDVVLMILGRGRVGFAVAGSAAAMVSILVIYFLLTFLRLPGVDRLAPLLIPLTIAQGVLGALGAIIGFELFRRRLSKLSAVRRIIDTKNG